ncbi:uncharacterized protein PAC_08352 [Phialocephala subalpina]|uniref:Protein kinase domain-containing protein n=1 Tax=Phialocephala subalpina TaxID=576137 RepID=A0A1L7X0C0_9HELO|nr:uncharacterized protein PAC_08352 [Phialocephala subalpina]
MESEVESSDDMGKISIFHLARDCANLFEEYLSAPRLQGKVVALSQRRFSSWAKFMGVFAPEDICLDTRLKYKPDIRGLVMLLLNVLNRNLRRAIKTHAHHSESVDGEAEHPTEPTGATYGIDGSIDRLHRLAVRIRQSSKDGLPERVRTFAKKLPSDDSEAIIREIIRFKYPQVNEELLTHLTRTVIYRRHRLMYIRRHQGKLAYERDQSSQSILEAAEPDIMHSIAQPTSGKTGLQLGISKTSIAEGYSETAPSIMNTDVYNQQDNVKQARHSTAPGSVSSSLIGKINYPAPPINKFTSSHATCPFCFEEFLVTEFENALWWRSHVDKDLEHYVCISEECNHSLLYFDNFNSWLDHMNETHTEAWPQFIHTLTTWRCIYPHSSAPVSFETVDELYSHLETDHGKGFNSRELLALAQKSKALKPRSLGTCPLCYDDIAKKSVPMADTESAKSKDAVATSKSENTAAVKPNSRRVEWIDALDHGVRNEPSDMRSAPALGDSTKTSGLRLKIAKHVAGHLKSLSFLSLRGLGAENESAASNSARAVQGFNEGESGSDPEESGGVTSAFYDELSFEDSAAAISVEEEDQENREICLLNEPPHNAPEWSFLQRTKDQPDEDDDSILRYFVQFQRKESASLREEHREPRTSNLYPPSRQATPADQAGSQVDPQETPSHDLQLPLTPHTLNWDHNVLLEVDKGTENVLESANPPFSVSSRPSSDSSVVNDHGDAKYLSEVRRLRTVGTSSGHQPLTVDLTHLGAEFADAIEVPKSNEFDTSVPSATVPAKEVAENDSDDSSKDEESLGMSIRAALQRSRSTSRERENFLPLDALEEIVTRKRVRLELANLPVILPEQLDYLTDHIWEVAWLFRSESSSKETTRRRLFAILSLLQKEGQIVDFINEDLYDSDLPFVLSEGSRKGLPQLNRKGEDGGLHSIQLFAKWRIYEIESFDNWQWKLLAPYFQLSTTKDQKVLHYNLADRVILPFIEDEDGDDAAGQWRGSGDVWRVKIHPAHCNIWASQDENPRYALKRLKYYNAEAFNIEISNLKRFSARGHLHLVRLLVTFSWREQYYLLFPWADSNLHGFWKRYPYPSNLEQDYYRLTSWFANQCLGIAEGLKIIQTTDLPGIEDSAYVYGRHGDLRPENILWFRDFQDRETTSLMGILKISDFSLTRFHPTTAKAQPNHLAMLSLTYRAPEYDVSKMISQKYDIWALGCIVLEFVTWFLMGHEEVDKFSRKRVADDSSEIRQDAFFNFCELEDNQGRIQMSARFKRSVYDEIKMLSQHKDCSDYLLDLLDFIETRLLRVSPRNRADCIEVVERFEQLHRECTEDQKYCTRRERVTPLTRSGSDLSVLSPMSDLSDAIQSQLHRISLPEHTGPLEIASESSFSLGLFNLAEEDMPVHYKPGWSVDTSRRSTSPVASSSNDADPQASRPQLPSLAAEAGVEGPMTPRNDAGPFIFDGSAGRPSDSRLASMATMNLNAAANTPPLHMPKQTKSFWKRLQKPFRTEKK